MKKTSLIIFMVLCMVLTVFLSSCFDEESYYTKTDTEALVKTLEEALTEKVSANEAAITALKTEYDAKIKALTDEGAALEAELAVLKTAHEQKLAELDAANKATQNELDALETAYNTAVTEINGKLTANETAISNAKTELQNKLDTLAADHDSEIASITALITALQNADTANEARIATLEQQVTELLNVPTYTVSFDLAGGEGEISAQTIKRYNKATKPTDPTREGYTFLGWFVGEEEWSFIGYSVTESMTLTARWEATTYTVRYYWDNELVYTDEATYGSAYTPYYYSLADYGVAKWRDGSSTLTPLITTVWTHTRDVELYAQKAYAGTDFLLSTSGTTATITDYQGTDTEVIIPDCVIQDSVAYQITAIGNGAFSRCSSLTSITIPASVTSIGSSAFYGCNSLTSINIPASVTSIGDAAFSGCSSLTSINIPVGVTRIGTGAFRNCSSLTSITIPSSVTSIGSWALEGCSGLSSIIVESGNTVYHSAGNCIIETATNTLVLGCKNSVILDYVTSIGDDAFYGCSSLTSINIPAGVTFIGYEAFSNCSGLSSIIVESGNTVYHSADNCIIETATNTLVLGCKNSVIPDYVTSIGYSAFYGCSNLTGITIPVSVTSIGNYAFCDCSSLTSINIPASVTSIGSSAFYGTGVIQNENGVSYVGKWAVDFHGNVTAVTLRDDTVGIADYVFFYCSSLTSITIPASVTSIGSGAFEGCSSLASITIPASVTLIGPAVFRYCSNLTSVTFENTTGWWCADSAEATSGTAISATDLENTSTAAKYLTDTNGWYYWKRG